jgi:uncharacterized RDD family membrane protein YckC
MIDAAPVEQSGFDTDGVLGRRLIAWLIDVLLVSLLAVALHLLLAVLGLVTFGLGWTLFALMPLLPFGYSFFSLASRHAATPGQRLMHLVVREHSTGRRPTPLEAFVSTALFFISLGFPPLFLIAMVAPRHRTLHDLCSGLLMVHEQPLTVRHGAWNINTGRTA